ncbi:dicarboxylate/amino acid:cation symporter [Jatrophihabitans fulvus]
MRSFVKTVNRVPFWGQTLLGLLVGALLGLVARQWDVAWLEETLTQIGSVFVSLLRTAVVPLVVTALIVSVSRLGQVANAARLAARTIMWFAVTALIAVVIGGAIGLITQPGRHTGLSTSGATAPGTTGSWTDFLTGLVPTNVLGLEASTSTEGGVTTTDLSFNVLQLVVIGIALGAAALAVGEKARPFLGFVESTLEIVQKALWWVIRLAPIGTAGLIGKSVATYGWDLLRPLALFTADIYIGCALVLFGVYPLLLRLHGLSPMRFLSGAWPAITLGFVSRSSIGTLPVTQEVTTRNLGVPQEYASFAVPLGATTKMDGCAAIYPAISAIFVAEVFGVDLSFTDYVLIAFVSVVGSAATAGLTGALVMLTLTLSTLGLPLEGAGLLLAIDPILDMVRTATNVAGQALVPVIVSAREGILDRVRYDARRSDVLGEGRARLEERELQPA